MKITEKPSVIIRHLAEYDSEAIRAILRDGMAELGLRPHGRTLVKPNIVAAGPLFPHAFTRPEFALGMLRALQDRLTEIAEGFESDLESGILTIEFDDGVKYVINSHRAARQIWMSAQRKAWHFDPRPADRTFNTPSAELVATVEQVLGTLLQRPIGLSAARC